MPNRLEEQTLLGFPRRDGRALAPSLEHASLVVQGQLGLRLARAIVTLVAMLDQDGPNLRLKELDALVSS